MAVRERECEAVEGKENKIGEADTGMRERESFI